MLLIIGSKNLTNISLINKLKNNKKKIKHIHSYHNQIKLFHYDTNEKISACDNFYVMANCVLV